MTLPLLLVAELNYILLRAHRASQDVTVYDFGD
jgi:hypothetical protein